MLRLAVQIYYYALHVGVSLVNFINEKYLTRKYFCIILINTKVELVHVQERVDGVVRSMNMDCVIVKMLHIIC